ncbi:hypothetical protein GLN21_10190 [Campylobacter coli]|nr:hypothetical protein [Campylobacter coli]
MGEDLKSDREINNQEHTESTNKTTHLESNKLESKRNIKNKDEVRLDFNGDEIVYEIWHNPTWWDYLMYFMLLFLGITMVYGGIEKFLSNEIEKSLLITSLIFGIPFTLLSSYRLFYTRKNRFYITTQGIGFERRHWFVMQKGFFKFGEVGAIRNIGSTGTFPVTSPSLITIFPLGNLKKKYFASWQLKPYCNISLTAWDIYVFPKIYDKSRDEYYLHDFLIKKTKEALKAQGVNIDTLCYDLDKQFDIY